MIPLTFTFKKTSGNYPFMYLAIVGAHMNNAFPFRKKYRKKKSTTFSSYTFSQSYNKGNMIRLN